MGGWLWLFIFCAKSNSSEVAKLTKKVNLATNSLKTAATAKKLKRKVF